MDWFEFRTQLYYGRLWKKIIQERKTKVTTEWLRTRRLKYFIRKRAFRLKTFYYRFWRGAARKRNEAKHLHVYMQELEKLAEIGAKYNPRIYANRPPETTIIVDTVKEEHEASSCSGSASAESRRLQEPIRNLGNQSSSVVDPSDEKDIFKGAEVLRAPTLVDETESEPLHLDNGGPASLECEDTSAGAVAESVQDKDERSESNDEKDRNHESNNVEDRNSEISDGEDKDHVFNDVDERDSEVNDGKIPQNPPKVWRYGDFPKPSVFQMSHISKEEKEAFKVLTTLSPEDAREYDWKIRDNLRMRLGNSGYYYYTMVGECYIHGMMDGEAMHYQNEGGEKGVIPAEVFEIR